MIPTFVNGTIDEIRESKYASKTYQVTDRVIGTFIDGVEALKQTIDHILRTERGAYEIYGDNYGVELKQYIGMDLSFISATIEDTIREALMRDDRVKSVKLKSIDKLSIDSVKIAFDVDTSLGLIKKEIVVNA